MVFSKSEARGFKSLVISEGLVAKRSCGGQALAASSSFCPKILLDGGGCHQKRALSPGGSGPAVGSFQPAGWAPKEPRGAARGLGVACGLGEGGGGRLWEMPGEGRGRQQAPAAAPSRLCGGRCHGARARRRR